MLPKMRLMNGDIICFGTKQTKSKQYVVPSLHFFNWRTSEVLYHIQNAKILLKDVETDWSANDDFYVIKTGEMKIDDIQVQLQKNKSLGLEKMFAKDRLPSLVREGTLKALPTMIQKHTSVEGPNPEKTK